MSNKQEAKAKLFTLTILKFKHSGETKKLMENNVSEVPILCFIENNMHLKTQHHCFYYKWTNKPS